MSDPSPLIPLPDAADIERLSWPAYLGLGLAAAVLGIAVSFFVSVFQRLIAVVYYLTYNLMGDAVQPSAPWAIALIPAVGGIVVAFILKAGYRPEKMQGMAHVIDGVAESGGRLNNRNGFAFVLASALGIGVGAPVGADTPAALIGAHLASWLGQRTRQREIIIRALVVAGAAAGISSTYFAQLAAIFFALEIVLGGFGGVVYVVPVLIAVSTSALVSWLVDGTGQPYTPLPGLALSHWSLGLYLGVALLATAASIAYVNLLPIMRRQWQRVNLPYWAKPALAGLIVGVVGLWLPDVFGTGLNQMKHIFEGQPLSFQALLALSVAKIILTPLSLGSGFAGGVIGPALLIGAGLGYALGDLCRRLDPSLPISPVTFALVCTAAMLAATFHAPLFGSMMVLEMSADYQLLVPVLLASAVAYALARRFQPGSAYTFALPAAGIHLRPGTFHVDRR